MKHLLIIYSVVFILLLLGKSSHASESKIDFDSLIPAEKLAAELKQNDTEDNLIENKGFWFHHRYPWVYPSPYYPPVYSPYYYPVVYTTPIVTCYASDAFGATWSQASYNVYEAQNAALSLCFRFSNRGCYSRGCTY
ncbi:MAG: hypothetical protein EBR01_02330 [Proteobacteria bacterium]|nr:hypothetical protein [Pseudomonadota bacterium]